MRLLLVRHGETQFNAEARYLGALDPPLTPRGTLQAQELSRLLPEAVDHIACSPLRRARQTADVLCARGGHRPLVLHAFRERDVGVFEGLTQAEARARYPDQWSRNVTRRWDAAPPGGETIAQVVQRVADGLSELLSRHAGRTVVLVAHGFVAKVIRGLVEPGKDDFFDWQLPNAGVIELDLDVNRDRLWFFSAGAALRATIERALPPGS